MLHGQKSLEKRIRITNIQAVIDHTFSTDVANLKIDSNNVKVVWYIPYFNLCKESQRLKMIGFALSLKIISEQLIF